MEKNAEPSQADPDMVSSIVGRLQEALNNNDILNAHRIAGQIQAIQRDLLHIEPDETLHQLFNEEEEKYHKFLANEEEIEEKIRPLERFLDIAEKNGEVSEIANKLAKIFPLVEKSHDLDFQGKWARKKERLENAISMAEKKPAASNESPPMTKVSADPFVETVKKISQLALRQLQEGNIEESLENIVKLSKSWKITKSHQQNKNECILIFYIHILAEIIREKTHGPVGIRTQEACGIHCVLRGYFRTFKRT